MGKQLSQTMVLHKFFGRKEGQTSREFGDELKKLSDEEKLELARLAAREMELERDEVDFDLS